MSSKQRKNYTVSELLDAAIIQAKEDPLYQKALQYCILDYELVSHAVKYDRLVKCEFDPVGLVRYGGSEGIYGSIVLYGIWAEGVNNGPYTSRMNVYTLKNAGHFQRGISGNGHACQPDRLLYGSGHAG